MAGPRVGADAVGAFVAGVLIIFAAVAIDDVTIGWIAGIVSLVLFIFAMSRAPLRYSLIVLAICGFTLDNPAEMFGDGHWHSPLAVVGALMLTHMKNTTGVSALFFSGTDVMLVSLIIITLYRRSMGAKIDRSGRVSTPKPLVRLAFVSLAGTAYVWISGLLRGGNFSLSLWQVDRVVYLPIVFLLFHMGLRGPKDCVALARCLLAAATVRAAMAVYIVQTVVLPPGPNGEPQKLQFATTHHDSVLFANAVVLIISLVIHRVRRAKAIALALLPILFWGMIANNRRMVWVQIILVFTTLFGVMPMTPIKRKIVKLMKILGPVAALYVAVGWNVNAPPFAPVQTIKGMMNSKDASSITRDIEDYDLVYTMKQFHIWGTGYGNGYWQMIPLPPMGYDLELYLPHNSLLGLWVFAGYFGFVAMTMLWIGGVYFGVRAYRMAKKPADQAAALTSFGAILIYIIQCFGDVGLGSWTGVFTVGASIALAGKLAVATGAWPGARAPERPARAAGPSPRSASGAAEMPRRRGVSARAPTATSG